MSRFDLFGPDLSSRVCLTLIHSLWQVTLFALVAWLVSRFILRRQVTWDYTAHVSALLLSGVSVVATFLFFTGAPRTTGMGQPSPIADQTEISDTDRVPTPMAEQTIASKAQTPQMQVIAEQQGSSLTVPEVPTSSNAYSWAQLWKTAAPWMVGGYLAGVVLMLGKLAAAIVMAERVRSQCRPLTEGPVFETLQHLAKTWSLSVVPALATAEQIVVPKVVGLFKPTILLPVALISGLSPQELELIVAHELAHIRRHDMWINLVQRLAEAVLFFNPALWVLSRRISALREYCCDEMACCRSNECDEASQLVYAQALLRVVELAHTTDGKQVELAALAASGRSPSELRRRVAHLFGEPIRESLQLSRGALLPLALAITLLLAQPVFTTLAEEPQPKVAENSFLLKVVDPDGNPVPNAEVEIRTRPMVTAEQIVTGSFTKAGTYGAFAETDEKGEFAIRLDESSKSIVFAVKQPGFAPYWAEWNSLDHPEPMPEEFTMQLDKGWVVGGILQDEDGNPVAGATVRPSVAFKMRPGVIRQLGIGTRIKTQEDGSWQFGCVPDSKNDLTIELTHPDLQPMWHTIPRDGYELKPMSPRGIITLQKGIEVSGVVTDESGVPIEDALVRTKFLNDVRKTTTDAQGKYVLKGCPPRKARIVVSAKGKALQKQDVRVLPEMKPVDFTMHPGGKVRVRVIDENGKGIAKSRIFFQNWDGQQIEYFEFDHINEYTNEDGVWEWKEAPLEPFDADICRAGGMQLTDRPLFSREEEFVFSPPPALVVSGNVVDEKTKKPISKFRVIPGLRNVDPGIGMDWSKRDSYDAVDGKYQVRFNREYPSHLVRIEADGYQVAISRDFKSDEGKVNYDFELIPAEDISAQIVDASGKPAAGAKIALGVAGNQISVSNGDIDDGSTYATRVDADAEGRFRLSNQIDAYQLIIIHEAGYAHFKSTDGELPDPLPLTPWAKLNGIYYVGPNPTANVELYMGIETLHSYGEGVPNIFTHYETTTGSDGTFKFDRVLPGMASIGRRLHLHVKEGATAVESSVRVHTEFVPGERVQLQVGGTGRPVVGKLIPPSGYQGKVLWNFAMISAQTDLVPPSRPDVPAALKNNPQEQEAWWNGWKQTPEGQAWSAAYKIYQRERSMAPYLDATVAPDGSFRIDDVPPGNYLMRVYFVENPVGSVRGHSFKVPPVEGGWSGEAIDLGSIVLEPR